MERLCLQIKDLQGEWTNAIFDVRTGFISLSSVGGWFISRSERCVSGVLGPVPFGKEIALVHSPCKSLICNSLVAEAFPCKACPKEHSTLRQLGSCIEDVKGTVHSNLCCARHGKDLRSNAQVGGNGALVGTGRTRIKALQDEIINGIERNSLRWEINKESITCLTKKNYTPKGSLT